MRKTMRLILRVLMWIGAVVLVLFFGALVWLYQFLTVFGNTIPTTSLTPSIAKSLKSEETISTPESWEAQKEIIRTHFEEEVYGAFPQTSLSFTHERRTLDENAYGGRATVEELVLVNNDAHLRIPIVLIIPNTDVPSPLIIASTFCASHTAFPEYPVERPAVYPAMCDQEGAAGLVHAVFGTYIDRFPVETLIEQGYALASFYTGSIVPDSTEHAPAALERLSTFSEKPVSGIISAWAWGYSQVMHALEVDPRIDEKRIALYGHSRDGKATLLAGAFDESVDAVITHQSGTGGVKPSRRTVGESIQAMMNNYPLWFDTRFLTYAGNEEQLPIDQHFLVALVAPRPLLATGARQDKWADPKGSFMSLREASAIYDLYTDKKSFTAEILTDFVPEDPLAFFMRPLSHGTRESDWNAFLVFLNAHFKP